MTSRVRFNARERVLCSDCSMLGVNEIRSDEEIPTDQVLALCESLLGRMEDPEMARVRRRDPEGYFRTLKTQFSRLNDRYPGIFNMLVQYGRRTRDGMEIVPQIRQMLAYRDQLNEGTITRERADQLVDYEYAQRYVRPVIGADRFDTIVKHPDERAPPEEAD